MKINLKDLVVLLFSIILLAGCSNEDDENNGDVDALITGSSGGLYEIIGSGMTNILNNNLDEMRLHPTVPPSVSETPRMLHENEALLGIGMVDMLNRSHNAVSEFDEEYDNVEALFGMYDNIMMMVAKGDDESINSVEDLRGKEIGVSSVSTQVTVTAYLEFMGITEDEVEWTFLSYSEQAEALKDGHIDVGNFSAYPHSGLMEELANAPGGIKAVNASEEQRDAFDEEYPEMAHGTIPGGTYPGLEEDAFYYTAFTVMYASGNITDEQGYEIVKSVFENREEMASIHPALEDLSPDKTNEYINLDIISRDNFNDGALEYFEEVNALTSEADS